VSQLWPDIPELEGIPEVLRSGIWMQAYLRALGRGTTWMLGLLCLAVCAGLCGLLGYRVANILGAVLGTVAGLVVGLVLIVRVIIEWQARRLVPVVRAAAGWPHGADAPASSPHQAGPGPK
jgi:hypothetical protein